MSTPELDLLVDLAYEHGAVAARMTGGGFGGAIVALSEASVAATLAERVAAAYAKRTGREHPRTSASRPTMQPRRANGSNPDARHRAP